MPEGAETSTSTAPAGGTSTGASSPAAPGASTQAAPQATPASANPAAPQQAPWSLDTWKDEDWDGLPERIRTAADKRAESIYTPKLTEAQTALQQHQADLAAARKEVQDARAAHLRGDPYGTKQMEEAKAALAKLQAEHEAYKAEWHPGRLDTYKSEVQKQWDAAREQANSTYEAAVQTQIREAIHDFAPWYAAKIGDAPNPQHDAARATIVDEFHKDFGAEMGIRPAILLQASGLNAAQRSGWVRAVLDGADPMAALREASKPPAYVASPAARVAPGAPRPAPRPDESFRPARPRDSVRDGMRQAVRAATGGRDLNPDR